MANANITAGGVPPDFSQSVQELLAVNLHVSNLLDLLGDHVEDRGETIVHALRRYINDEFRILKHLEGDDDWDNVPAPRILTPAVKTVDSAAEDDAQKGGA